MRRYPLTGAARKIQAAFRRYRAIKGYRLGMRKRRAVMRSALTYNPMPTFTETYSKATIGANVGGVFSARITDIPQIAQYATLYKQYRINWIKVMLVPVWNYDSSDANAGAYNNANAVPFFSAARIAYAINDSPGLVNPANETDVLTDNGCKIKPIKSKWSCSFKPVPDVSAISNAGANAVATRQKFRQWFNIDTVTTGNNPLHYGVSYFITQNVPAGADGVFNVYYKVNFSLRDPQ